MIMQKKLERRRKKREDVKGGSPEESKEQIPPSEPAPMDKTPSPKSPVMTPHPHTKYSPGRSSPIGRPPPGLLERKAGEMPSPDRQPDNKSTLVQPQKPGHGGKTDFERF